ncbi:hypothetical protein D3C76_1588690 [compost metagenome]
MSRQRVLQLIQFAQANTDARRRQVDGATVQDIPRSPLDQPLIGLQPQVGAGAHIHEGMTVLIAQPAGMTLNNAAIGQAGLLGKLPRGITQFDSTGSVDEHISFFGHGIPHKPY